MPSTFLDAKIEILQYAKRDISDPVWSNIAGSIINESVVKLQRVVSNLSALGRVESGFLYPVGEKTVNFTNQETGTDVNKVMSVHLVQTSEDWEGLPLRVYTYEQLMGEIKNFNESKVRVELDMNSANTFAEYVRSVWGHVAFTLGSDIGLYPPPSEPKILAIHYTPWLPALVADLDTNTLLRYCWEFILYASLVRLNLLLSESDRIAVSGQLLSIALGEVRNWDKSLSYSNPIEM